MISCLKNAFYSKKNAFTLVPNIQQAHVVVPLSKMKTQVVVVMRTDEKNERKEPLATFVDCKYTCLAAKKAIKQMFDNTSMKMDNIVLPTGEPTPKAFICFVFDRASQEQGHVLPPNDCANEIIFKVYGCQQHTFHGRVAMFYIDEAGSKISQEILDSKALEAAVKSMQKAIQNGGRMTHVLTFCDKATTEEVAVRAAVLVQVAEPES